MKVLALLFVIGCASASFYDALDHASDEVVADFLLGMDFAPSLQDAVGGLGYSNNEELYALEEDIKTELGKTLRESLDEVLNRIRERVEKGKEVGRELVEKAKEISEKLKEVGQEAGSKAKELLEKIKEKARDWLKELLSKIGLGKRSLVSDLLETLSVRSVLQRLVEKISNKLNLEQIREYVKKFFGEFSQLGRKLLETLKLRGNAAIKDLISSILPQEEHLDESDYVYELIPVEDAVAPHIQKRWVVVAKAACMLIKYIGLGWGKNQLQNWIDNNVEPDWRNKMTVALKVGVPVLKKLLGRFCYASPEGPVDFELVPVEDAVAPHIQKRWIVIAKAACMLVKYIGLGWGKNKLQSWINNNVEDKWRGKLTAALKVSVPALKFLLGRFCYAAAPSGPADYSLAQLWEKIKEFFRGLGLEVQERFFNFAMWVREAVGQGVLTMKEKLDKIKGIAKEVVEKAKTMSKETAREALEFLQPYKEQLGSLFDDAKEAIKRVLGREF